jgi:hypothetical protein
MQPNSFAELVDMFLGFISLLVPFVFSLALLVIVWKVIDAWVIHAGDVKKIEEGKKYAVTGILVLVVMSGIWAIVRLLRSSIFG